MDKIGIIDFGGQYSHLIGSRIRDLHVYSEIWSPDLNEYNHLSKKEKLKFKGIIFSGGPQSVYDRNAVNVNKQVYELDLPILAICYGHHLVIREFGGQVSKGRVHEYGLSKIKFSKNQKIFNTIKNTAWMSHGDYVEFLPSGFKVLAKTDNCPIAASINRKRKILTVQFHPEVSHTLFGNDFLKAFLKLCKIKPEWSIKKFLNLEIQKIKNTIKNKRVILFVSGGVDSTVVYVLLNKSLPKNKIYPLIIDTGLMRQDEIRNVKNNLKRIGLKINVRREAKNYIAKLKDVYLPEEKRKIIGKYFIEIQDQVSKKLKLQKNWILAQGTIYPDTIESGGSNLAATIKTHHNRVPEVLKLIEEGRVIEPIKELYKHEVRKLARQLKIPAWLFKRQPFPGPGLAVRILNVAPDLDLLPEINLIENNIKNIQQPSIIKILQSYEYKIIPIKSVGIKGDKRSYEMSICFYGAINWKKLDILSTYFINNVSGINRAVFDVIKSKRPASLRAFTCYINNDRINRIRAADNIVNNFQLKHKLLGDIWQFPVVLIPVNNDKIKAKESLGKKNFGLLNESIVLRPVQSIEAMTVNFYKMNKKLLTKLVKKLSKLPWLDSIYYDITHKPPGTIEWE